jgi:hypothetical protein
MATNWMLSRRRYSLAAQAGTIVDLFINGVGVQPAGKIGPRARQGAVQGGMR